MEQKKEQRVGDIVVYVDPTGKPHNALVTAWWGKDCCNLVYVVSDERKRDDYGRQIEHSSSVPRKSENWPHGNYFMELGEEPLPYRPPTAV
jgi:hypothetical protein